MYCSALVALKPCASNDAVMSYAISLAQRHALKLTGIAILDRDLVAPSEPVPLGGSAFKAHRDEVLVARTRAGIADVLAEFQQRCTAAGVISESISVEDHIAWEIAQCVQRFDLLLVGHDVNDGESVIHDVLKHCPRPAIVVPEIPDASRSAVVVAYDGSVQAARAVEAFVASGFERTSPVHVVALNVDLDVAEHTANQAARYLRGHGFNVSVQPTALEHSVAEHLRHAVEQHAACLLVLGAYGKPAIQEFFFGSVTRTILKTVTIPILLDH